MSQVLRGRYQRWLQERVQVQGHAFARCRYKVLLCGEINSVFLGKSCHLHWNSLIPWRLLHAAWSPSQIVSPLCLSVCLPACCLSVCVSVCISVFLSVCPSVLLYSYLCFSVSPTPSLPLPPPLLMFPITVARSIWMMTTTGVVQYRSRNDDSHVDESDKLGPLTRFNLGWNISTTREHPNSHRTHSVLFCVPLCKGVGR